MATSSASAAARPQTNNRLHVVGVRNKLRALSTVGYRKRFATLCEMWIACGTSASHGDKFSPSLLKMIFPDLSTLLTKDIGSRRSS